MREHIESAQALGGFGKGRLDALSVSNVDVQILRTPRSCCSRLCGYRCSCLVGNIHTDHIGPCLHV